MTLVAVVDRRQQREPGWNTAAFAAADYYCRPVFRAAFAAESLLRLHDDR
jgi:hypothetical protein